MASVMASVNIKVEVVDEPIKKKRGRKVSTDSIYSLYIYIYYKYMKYNVKACTK